MNSLTPYTAPVGAALRANPGDERSEPGQDSAIAVHGGVAAPFERSLIRGGAIEAGVRNSAAIGVSVLGGMLVKAGLVTALSLAPASAVLALGAGVMLGELPAMLHGGESFAHAFFAPKDEATASKCWVRLCQAAAGAGVLASAVVPAYLTAAHGDDYPLQNLAILSSITAGRVVQMAVTGGMLEKVVDGWQVKTRLEHAGDDGVAHPMPIGSQQYEHYINGDSAASQVAKYVIYLTPAVVHATTVILGAKNLQFESKGARAVDVLQTQASIATFVSGAEVIRILAAVGTQAVVNAARGVKTVIVPRDAEPVARESKEALSSASSDIEADHREVRQNLSCYQLACKAYNKIIGNASGGSAMFQTGYATGLQSFYAAGLYGSGLAKVLAGALQMLLPLTDNALAREEHRVLRVQNIERDRRPIASAHDEAVQADNQSNGVELQEFRLVAEPVVGVNGLDASERKADAGQPESATEPLVRALVTTVHRGSAVPDVPDAPADHVAAARRGPAVHRHPRHVPAMPAIESAPVRPGFRITLPTIDDGSSSDDEGHSGDDAAGALQA